MTRAKAIQFIQKHGVLLVFPIQNQKLPASLWSSFYPRTPMRWEWDDSGDNRVAELWHLREELSRSGKVVYAKWYKNRATVFSPECFRWFRSVLHAQPGFNGLSTVAQKLFSVIADNSPISTKEIKKTAKEQFGLASPTVEKAYPELWRRLLITGYGEVDDGAFPSLAVGAADRLFEQWTESADAASPDASRRALEKKLGADNLFVKELARVVQRLDASPLIKQTVKKTGKAKALTYEDLVGR